MREFGSVVLHSIYDEGALAGVEIVDAPEYAGFSLELLAELDPDSVDDEGRVVLVGLNRTVRYVPEGLVLDFGRRVLVCRLEE